MELEPGVEGLIHVSEMSWTKKNIHPGKIVSTSQQVDVQILEVEPQRRRISLGLKQTQDNPWEVFLAAHPKGSIVEGPIRNITEFGLFVGLDGGVDGMVHLSDLDWNRTGDEAIKDYKKGDTVRAAVLDVDPTKERISLGIKQAAGDPMEKVGSLRKGSQVTCEVIAVQDNGIEVKIVDTDITTFIKRSDLSRDRSEQRPERFNVGDKVDAADHQRRHQEPPHLRVHQVAGDRRGEAGRRPVRLDRQRRVARRHLQGGHQEEGRGVAVVPTVIAEVSDAAEVDTGSDAGTSGWCQTPWEVRIASTASRLPG